MLFPSVTQTHTVLFMRAPPHFLSSLRSASRALKALLDSVSTQTLSLRPHQYESLFFMCILMVSTNLAPLGHYWAREGKNILLLGVFLLLRNTSCRILCFWLLVSQPLAQYVKNQAERNERCHTVAKHLKGQGKAASLEKGNDNNNNKIKGAAKSTDARATVSGCKSWLQHFLCEFEQLSASVSSSVKWVIVSIRGKALRNVQWC